jgi:cobalt-zinc-cadmium efflux system outer membrane protein
MQKPSLLPALCIAVLLGSSALSQSALAEPAPADPATQPQEQAAIKDDAVLTLSEAIQKALDASPRLKSASAGLDAAKGLQEQAGYMPNPQLEILAENVAGSGRFSGFDSAETTFGVSQEIEWGGKRGYRQQAATHGTTYGEYGLTIERLNLIRDVQIAYHNAVAAQEALALAEERKKLAGEMRGTVNERVQSAAEPAIQLRKAEIGLSTATVIEERARREFKHTKHVLASLWAGHDEAFGLSDDLFFELSPPPTEDEVENKLAKTADLKRWESEQQRYAALYELEKAEAIPNPRVTLGVRDFRANDDQALVAGVSIPIPVFNGNSGNIASAKSKVSQAESDKQNTHLTMRNEVFESLEEMINAYAHANTLKADIIPSAQQAFKLARNGYQAGRFPYLEVLDSQRTLFEVKEQYIEALKAYHTARANVERMTTITGEQQ